MQSYKWNCSFSLSLFLSIQRRLLFSSLKQESFLKPLKSDFLIHLFLVSLYRLFEMSEYLVFGNLFNFLCSEYES
jgi:hypothetical protein